MQLYAIMTMAMLLFSHFAFAQTTTVSTTSAPLPDFRLVEISAQIAHLQALVSQLTSTQAPNGVPLDGTATSARRQLQNLFAADLIKEDFRKKEAAFGGPPDNTDISQIFGTIFGIGTDASLSQGMTPTVGASSSSCPALSRTLGVGAQGADVTTLQSFLKSEGLFDVEPTGYFGPITEEAVKRFQAREGIVSEGDATTTGYGLVGPKTREHIAKRCSM